MAVATMGDSAEASLTVTDRTIDDYAAVVGDENPIHTDPAYAAETMFDGEIAHGMLTAGVVSGALAQLPGDIIYLSQDLRFENPVRPGETITANVIVAEDLGGDRIRVLTEATSGDQTVLSGEAVVLSVPHES